MRLLFIFCFVIIIFAGPVSAQQEPPLPESIQGLVSKGAQVKYLGRLHGLDGWIMVYKGQEQYFYATPDGKAFVSGLLFTEKGDPLTVQQVQNLQKTGQAGILDSLVDRQATQANPLTSRQDELKEMSRSPAEKLFRDVRDGNWVTFGSSNAPVAYAFIDPTCPHCHDFIDELRQGYLDQGEIQLRVLPVSRLTDDQAILQKAAYLLVSPTPATDFYAHIDGSEDALPTNGDLSTQAVQQNMAIMQKWQLDAIPFVIYKDKGGSVKIIRGKVSDPNVLIQDLG